MFIIIAILIFSFLIFIHEFGHFLAAKLFDEYAPKYAERHGGYTRIVKIGLRKGDAAMEVLMELV